MNIETVEEMLRDALDLHGRHDTPTTREVPSISLRLTCAQQGMPKPDLDSWPPYERVATHFAEPSEQQA